MSQSYPGSATATGSDRIPAAMEAFSNLSDAWGLSTEEQITLLGSPGRSTFFKWKKSGGNLPNDTFERISHLLSIYKALQILFTDPNAADEWVKKENSFFEGESALQVMLNGQVADIYRVREYVNAQRGG